MLVGNRMLWYNREKGGKLAGGEKMMQNEKVFAMSFGKVYPMLIAKV